MTDKIETVVTAAIVEVQTRQVGADNRTLWEIITPDGTKWTTFKAEIGKAALALKGQVADLKVVIQKKGEYTNHYLNKVRLSPGSPANAAATPVQAAAAAAIAAQAAGPIVDYEQYQSGEREKEDRRNASIHRQTAAKVAAHLLDRTNGEGQADFWANVEQLVEFFKTGTIPGTPEPSSVTSHTAPDDDDIPF